MVGGGGRGQRDFNGDKRVIYVTQDKRKKKPNISLGGSVLSIS